MQTLIEFFLKRRLVVNILLLAIFLLAFKAVMQTNRNAYPEVDLSTLLITTDLGLIPTAYGIGGPDPFIEPMVLAIAWGLLFAAMLILYMIPCLYVANRDIVFFVQRIFRRILAFR